MTERLRGLLERHGLAGPPGHEHPGGAGDATVIALLLGSRACEALAGFPVGPASPVSVPDLVAVVLEPADPPRSRVEVPVRRTRAEQVGQWEHSWSDAEHVAAVQQVQSAIARGDLYQANVVGHRSAPYAGDPLALAAAVADLPGATYGGVLAGQGWTVGCASPEQLVRVTGRRVTTRPVKGTRVDGPGAVQALLGSAKDRAEHVMIVDLERNDLARVCETGSVEVEELYALSQWSGLWHAASTVSGTLRADAGVLDVLAALAPGGSVTGAPKRAACELLADLEPVGRGPSMGAFGVVHAGGLDLGLTIRTVALDEERVHLWAGGGITWSSDPWAELAEAHAKAAPVIAALEQAGRRACD